MQRLKIGILAALICLVPTFALASDPVQKTVEALHQEKEQLSGQQVQLRGKIVKVNNQIMGRNFLHLQDGSGKEGTNDLTVTSQETAEVGDEVVITGTVAVNTDFGSGYMYPLLLEKATISKAGH